MVYIPAWKPRDPRWSRLGLLGFLGILVVFCAPSLLFAQAADRKKAPSSTAAPGDESKEKGKDNDGDDDKRPANAPDAVADPSQTRRIASMEIFKDPNVEGMLDLSKFRQVEAPAVSPQEILMVKEMAQNPNVNLNRPVMDRVVRALAAKLSDHQSIRAILNDATDEEASKAGVPDKKKTAALVAKRKAEADTRRIVQQATTDLLEPIYSAKKSENQGFLTEYRRSLLQYLPPLLKNHLIPRVQAMIVLGEAAGPEYLPLFQGEVGNKAQSLWVKLWALEGITNIKLNGGRASNADEAKAAKLISDFLDSEKELPWPIQFRAIQALGALRQGFLPTSPQRAQMAQTAMTFLMDNDARMEVRVEAAHTLGLMQITSAVPRYNFILVAHAVAELAAQLTEEISAIYSVKPLRSENPTKARYLTALLVGPLLQAFEGDPGQSGSGLSNAMVGNDKTAKEIRQIAANVRRLAQGCVELLTAPPREYVDRKKALATGIAGLRKYLEDNPAPNRRLVPSGRQFGDEARVRNAAPDQPLVDLRRGR